MKALPAYREGWLLTASAYVEQGRLPAELRPVIEAAAAGDARLFGVVVNAVFHVDRFTREQLSQVIAELPPSRATAFHSRAQQAVESLAARQDRRDRSEPNGIVLSPDTVLRIFEHRLARFALKPLPFPEAAEHRLFVDIEYARDQIPELANQARAGIADRISRVVLNELRLERDAISIPPPPSQIAFAAIVADALQTPLAVIQAWQRWEGWPEVLSRIFVRLLADGRPEGGRSDSVAFRIAQIAERRAWFEDPLIQQLGMAQILRAHESLFKDAASSSGIKALAELSRFSSGALTPQSSIRKAAALQAGDLHELHGMAPLLEGDQFLALLTPYLRPLKPEAMSSAFKDPEVPITPFGRYLARVELTWHFGTPQQVADMLQRLISRNKRYREPSEFSSVMLGVSSEVLGRKIERLSLQGADVLALLQALEEQFPSSHEALLKSSPHLEEVARTASDRREAPRTGAAAQAASIGGFAEGANALDGARADGSPSHRSTPTGMLSPIAASKPQQLCIPGLTAATPPKLH